jgi:hypothetical protein
MQYKKRLVFLAATLFYELCQICMLIHFNPHSVPLFTRERSLFRADRRRHFVFVGPSHDDFERVVR